jgi:hypothetical protein
LGALKRISLAQAGLLFLLGLALLAALLAVVSWFMNLPTAGTTLAIDNITYALRDWDIRYDVVNGLRYPPWSVLVYLPLGQIPLNAAWGVIVFATIVVITLSVPRFEPRWRYVFGLVAALAAYGTVRVLLDAQHEVLVIAGVLLMLWGYRGQRPLPFAAGALLATAKPQAVFLFLLVIGLYTLQTWPPRRWLAALGLAALVVVPTLLWKGEAWLAAMGGTYQVGSYIDFALRSSMTRAGLPAILTWLPWLFLLGATLWLAWRSDRSMSRSKAGMLLAASLLLAPYTANALALYIIGVIPLIGRRIGLALLLIALVNAFYFLHHPAYVQTNGFLWTAWVLLVWAALAWSVWHDEIALPQPATLRSDNS